MSCQTADAGHPHFQFDHPGPTPYGRAHSLERLVHRVEADDVGNRYGPVLPAKKAEDRLSEVLAKCVEHGAFECSLGAGCAPYSLGGGLRIDARHGLAHILK